MKLSVTERLAILADAAKYDASCASSGTIKRSSLNGGLGSTEGMGICHSYAPDGRCISLLKLLLTNHCVFDCLYCVNRVSSNVRRARFTPQEVVDLTLNFYKRNYIEGLFLSSGVVKSPNHTMEQLILVAQTLREVHDFRGYIHLKTMPEADPALIEKAGLYADRLSINIELPREQSLDKLAPQKDGRTIRKAMGGLRLRLEEAKAERKTSTKAPQFAPAGQSTQMIVGADGESDADILTTSSTLYGSYNLKRVYYSAFSPIPDASRKLPVSTPPLMREHRIYQADWLYRFYGFRVDEILAGGQDGMLDLAIDPKLAWALRHREQFPVDINRADRDHLLRVPGLGTKSVKQILSARRYATLRFRDVARLTGSTRTVKNFIETPDWTPRRLEDADLRGHLGSGKQLALF